MGNKFYHYKGKGIYWFRITGYGLCFKHMKYFNLSFSQRNGYTKYLKIGKLLITVLTPKNTYLCRNKYKQ